MKYFIEKMNLEQLRKEYHQLCLAMHPDKGGNHDMFVEMQAEYTLLLPGAIAGENIDRGFTVAHEKDIMDMIEKMMNISNIIIDICGSWLWVGGNTWAVHQQLKDLGFKFSGKKKMWHWSPYRSAGKRRGRYTMEQIYSKFGRETVETDRVESIAA